MNSFIHESTFKTLGGGGIRLTIIFYEGSTGFVGKKGRFSDVFGFLPHTESAPPALYSCRLERRNQVPTHDGNFRTMVMNIRTW